MLDELISVLLLLEHALDWIELALLLGVNNVLQLPLQVLGFVVFVLQGAEARCSQAVREVGVLVGSGRMLCSESGGLGTAITSCCIVLRPDRLPLILRLPQKFLELYHLPLVHLAVLARQLLPILAGLHAGKESHLLIGHLELLLQLIDVLLLLHDELGARILVYFRLVGDMLGLACVLERLEVLVEELGERRQVRNHEAVGVASETLSEDGCQLGLTVRDVVVRPLRGVAAWLLTAGASWTPLVSR